MNKQKLLSDAKKILKENWRTTNTVPSAKLYPHQWNWDSGFIAIAYSNFDQKKGQTELLSLFQGQWKNGMLPHIIFRARSDYFPNEKFWQSKISKDAPELETSGITQPPMQAIAAWHIYENAKNKTEAKKFLEIIYPKIIKFHEFLLNQRDPEKTGLVTIFHPWESGLDNSIRWDSALRKVKPKNLPNYKRTDNKKVDSSQRPSDDDYDKYVYISQILKKYNYDNKKAYKHVPFRIKDIIFNTILIEANYALLRIAKVLKQNPKKINTWIKKSEKSYHKYFFEDGFYYDYDLISKKRIKIKTIASLIPLYLTHVKNKEAKKIFENIDKSFSCQQCTVHFKLATSLNVSDKNFNPMKYWRGPIWLNVNWLLYEGLKKHKMYYEARELKHAMLDLVNKSGFYEYFNPNTGQGIGIKDFSWSAAMIIDLILEKRERF